jgi:hypothetical protein
VRERRNSSSNRVSLFRRNSRREIPDPVDVFHRSNPLKEQLGNYALRKKLPFLESTFTEHAAIKGQQRRYAAADSSLNRKLN